ncbi:MAG TPA: efflux RND transporter periplasmic adaptor subunit [Vicinamibacterales bacterium]|nr:efflux RND transporter periplasmic adaptor subunit [Vicinamibacterales bacterium]
MSRNKKIVIGLIVVALLGAIAYANIAFTRTTGASVTAEKIEKRDLEAIVSASGTIQPVRQINVGAPAAGNVVELNVREGDTVKAGQVLMQIDPRNLAIQVDSQNQSLAAARSQLEETRRSIESAKAALTQSKAAYQRQEGLMKSGLTSREALESAQNDLTMRQAAVDQAEQSIKTQETRIKQQESLLQNAQYDLSKMRLVSPLDGIVTKRNVDIGEMVSGNQFQTVALITIADMSVIRAEIEVDETDIPNVTIGQPAKVTIDALPDKTFRGRVTEVGNSPIAASAGSTTRATNFLVKITIDDRVPNVRPGFTCTSTITTATRQKAISVPIQAMTLREVVLDEEGQIVHEPIAGARGAGPAPRRSAAGSTELKPGQTRKEIEGVFLVRDGHAVFSAVKTGIAGEKYFEVLDGLKEGDQVITGPFQSVRTMKDGDAVKIEAARTTTTPTPVK